ncbi:olfactory receptor class A-like protein 1 [Bombina bombina]|uniref:olfactory receptor class A-like protein 1 n=1 Tax=Bombina bombina TaxID=8345 RepID=UPI00235AB1CB|nr:olfactory receptor class A-like protein 1 [Bombina bombina]
MDSLYKAIGFLLLVVIGIPGNTFILLQFSYCKIFEKKLLTTNLILMVLALANFLVVLSRVIPQSLNAIGLDNLLDDIECKFVIFTFRVSRAMSICVTSLLSCHQCILIAPNKRLCIYLKQRVAQNMVVILLALWILNIVIYPYSVLQTRTRRNRTTSPYTLHLIYCDVDFLGYMAYIVNGSIYAVRDFIFVGLMTLASIYIVILLLRHEKSVMGIRSSDRRNGRTVEYKASRAVIMLVALYVVLYGLDNSMWIYTLTLSNVNSDINDLRIFLSSAYSTLSPIVVIATNPKLQQRFRSLYKKMLLSLTFQNSSQRDCNVSTIS